MVIYGIDFTSSPSREKPITCCGCQLESDILRVLRLEELPDFKSFEKVLRRSGPWVSGIDFPFGQAGQFVKDMGWPLAWKDYVSHVHDQPRERFVAELDDYRKKQPKGEKERRRLTDKRTGALAPNKIHYQPVGKMFFEGAPRLKSAGVKIPGLQAGDSKRIVIEAYPGTLARHVTEVSYKSDDRKNQTEEQRTERRAIVDALSSGALSSIYGVTVESKDHSQLVDDPKGDSLDGLLCAVQAAWAWRNRSWLFEGADGIDPCEGWIADPKAVRRSDVR